MTGMDREENAKKLRKGYVHVYTGDGKGKTTAALGLAVRALGAGLRVFIAQFAKGMHYSELDTIESLGDRIRVRQYGRTCFIEGEPTQEDRDCARRGLEESTEVLAGGRYDIAVLDEACIALHYRLFSTQDLLDAVRGRADGVEVVITGRRAPKELIDAADLVTEMREVKHYYARGVKARKGIES